MQCLLNNQQVFEDVMKSHNSSGGCLRDFCDGCYVKNHVLFGNDPTALQIIAYYNDIEVANPLRSKRRKHKVGKKLNLYA